MAQQVTPSAPPKEPPGGGQPPLPDKVNVRWLAASPFAVLLMGGVLRFLLGKGIPPGPSEVKPTDEPQLAAMA